MWTANQHLSRHRLLGFEGCRGHFKHAYRIDCIEGDLVLAEDSFDRFLVRCFPFAEVLLIGEVAVGSIPGNVWWKRGLANCLSCSSVMATLCTAMNLGNVLTSPCCQDEFTLSLVGF